MSRAFENPHSFSGSGPHTIQGITIPPRNSNNLNGVRVTARKRVANGGPPLVFEFIDKVLTAILYGKYCTLTFGSDDR